MSDTREGTWLYRTQGQFLKVDPQKEYDLKIRIEYREQLTQHNRQLVLGEDFWVKRYPNRLIFCFYEDFSRWGISDALLILDYSNADQKDGTPCICFPSVYINLIER